MFNEIDLNDLKNELEEEFYLKLEVKENKLYCNEFIGTYFYIEDLCESICYWIEGKYNCFSDYFILDGGYEFIIEVF